MGYTKKKEIDREWEDLFQRLEEDGLIPENATTQRFRRVKLRMNLYRHLRLLRMTKGKW